MKRRVGYLAIALVVLLIGLVAAPLVAPQVLWPDNPVPQRVSGYVDDARHAVERHVEGLRIVHFRLEGARCRTDGAVVMLFEQVEFPFISRSHAYAMSGTWPPTDWSVGINLNDALTDPEVVAFLGPTESPCE
jgi:hypothetical protein